MTGPLPPGDDLAALSRAVSPQQATAAAERFRVIADRVALDGPSLSRDRLLSWADALEVAAALQTAATPSETAEAAGRLRQIADHERTTRGDQPRAVDWTDALIAAVSVMADL